MRKYLLPENGNYYKANLHCHSTISDGGLTPKQIKEIYMSRGYSIVAYTDHQLFVRHNDLTDENFLALNGYEADVTESVSGSRAIKQRWQVFLLNQGFPAPDSVTSAS